MVQPFESRIPQIPGRYKGKHTTNLLKSCTGVKSANAEKQVYPEQSDESKLLAASGTSEARKASVKPSAGRNLDASR